MLTAIKFSEIAWSEMFTFLLNLLRGLSKILRMASLLLVVPDKPALVVAYGCMCVKVSVHSSMKFDSSINPQIGHFY